MTPFEQSIFAGRIGAQDYLIGLLLGVVVKAGAVNASALAALIEKASAEARASGRTAEAVYLQQRAEALRG